MNVLEFGKALMPLVRKVDSKMLSIAVNSGKIAVVLRPSKGVGPTRLKKIINESKIYPDLFKLVGVKKGKIMTSGSFGSHYVNINNGWRDIKMTPTQQGRFTPLLALEFEGAHDNLHTLTDLNDWGLLYALFDLKVYLNGQSMTTESRGATNGYGYRRVPFVTKWRVAGHNGTVTYDYEATGLTVIQNGEVFHKEDYPLPFFLRINSEKEIEDFDDFINRLSLHLRKKLLPKNIDHESFDLNDPEFQQSLKPMMKDFLGTKAKWYLLGLLGYSLQTTVTGQTFMLPYGSDLGVSDFTLTPFAMKGVSEFTTSLLPAELGVVASENTPHKTEGAHVEIKTTNGLGTTGLQPINVQVVEQVMLKNVELPFIYLLPNSQFLLDGEMTTVKDTPWLLIPHQGRSPRQIWADLVGDRQLLVSLISNLHALYPEDFPEDMKIALPEEQNRQFNFDEEVAAYFFLSQSNRMDMEMSEFLKVVGPWLLFTSFVDEAREQTELREDFVCTHEVAHDSHMSCLEVSRMGLLDFLFDGAEGINPNDYKRHFQLKLVAPNKAASKQTMVSA